MRVAAIDIGTNTVLLLIADIESELLVTVHDEQRLPRLGRHVDLNREINLTAFDRIAWIINEYKNFALQMRSDRIVAVATSAVRDATNQEEFLTFLRQTSGINVEVLSGDEEARCTYDGALSGFPEFSSQGAVLDIGGGSTELCFPSARQFNGDPAIRRYSLQIGALRISERFFKHDPPTLPEIEGARRYILEEFSQVHNPGFGSYKLIGVAGTATTVASLDQHLSEFDVRKISGYVLTRDAVDRWLSRLMVMPSMEIRALSGTVVGREDILTAGVLILREGMDLFGFDEICVSERGLRYGIVLREWRNNA